MKFIDYIEVKGKSIFVQRETANDYFDKLEEDNLEADSLLKCRVVKKGLEATDFYSVGDLVFVSASYVRRIKHSDCPTDVFIVNNEDLIFGKIKE